MGEWKTVMDAVMSWKVETTRKSSGNDVEVVLAGNVDKNVKCRVIT